MTRWSDDEDTTYKTTMVLIIGGYFDGCTFPAVQVLPELKSAAERVADWGAYEVGTLARVVEVARACKQWSAGDVFRYNGRRWVKVI